jgi:hypothetical protein
VGVGSSVQAPMGARVKVGAGVRVQVRVEVGGGGGTSDFANFSPIILSTV